MNYDHPIFRYNSVLFHGSTSECSREQHLQKMYFVDALLHCVKLNRNSRRIRFISIRVQYSVASFRWWTLAEKVSIFQWNGVMFEHNDSKQLLPKNELFAMVETSAGNGSE